MAQGFEVLFEVRVPRASAQGLRYEAYTGLRFRVLGLGPGLRV